MDDDDPPRVSSGLLTLALLMLPFAALAWLLIVLWLT
jgi:hypothetical protein